MKKSENTRWGVFPLDELFDISSTQSSIDKNKLTGQSGLTPYITRTDRDNGIDDFIGNQPSYTVDEGNVITIGLDTQTVFYQPSRFYTGQNVQVLKNEFLNKHIALYMIPLIKVQMVKFNWGGNGATLGRLKKVTIKLPVTGSCTPDYRFMERYMKQVEKKLLTRYRDYIGRKDLKNEVLVGKMKERKWKAFVIDDVFEIKSGVRLIKQDMKEGIIPFIGATDSNNGITAFCGNNVLLFLKNSILQQQRKFQYGYKFNEPRMKSQYIMLPVTTDDEPDYEYMEVYMRNIEYRLINRYIDKRLKNLEAE